MKKSLAPCLVDPLDRTGCPAICHHTHIWQRCTQRRQPGVPPDHNSCLCTDRHGILQDRWKDFELAITNNITGVSSALIILLIIGALSGAWMISGVVPTLIYYGIQIIHPSFS